MKKITKQISLDGLIDATLRGDAAATEGDGADGSSDALDAALNAPIGKAAAAAAHAAAAEESGAAAVAPADADDGKSPLEKAKEAIDAEFAEDTTITIGNLREKSQMESAIKGKWASKLMAEKVRGIRLRKKLERLCSGLEKMYSESRTTPSSYLGSRRATEGMLSENKDVRNLRRAVEDNKLIVEYLERLWTAIQGFGYTIRNSLESAKLEMGI